MSIECPISTPAANNSAICIADNTVFAVFADVVIARATFFYGLPVSGSRTQSTAFPWLLRDIRITIRKAWWREHILWSGLFRFWTDSAIISIANLSRNKRRRCGLPLSKSGFTAKNTTAALYAAMSRRL